MSVLREGCDQWDDFAISFRQDVELVGSGFKLLPLGFRDTVEDLLLSSVGIAACPGRPGEAEGTNNGVFHKIDFILVADDLPSLGAEVKTGSAGCNWNNGAKASTQLGLVKLWPPFAFEPWLLL